MRVTLLFLLLAFLGTASAFVPAPQVRQVQLISDVTAPTIMFGDKGKSKGGGKKEKKAGKGGKGGKGGNTDDPEISCNVLDKKGRCIEPGKHWRFDA